MHREQHPRPMPDDVEPTVEAALRTFALAAKKAGKRGTDTVAEVALRVAHRGLLLAIERERKEAVEQVRLATVVDFLQRFIVWATDTEMPTLEGLTPDQMHTYRRAHRTAAAIMDAWYPGTLAAALAQVAPITRSRWEQE
jgi:hypothetical protein